MKKLAVTKQGNNATGNFETIEQKYVVHIKLFKY